MPSPFVAQRLGTFFVVLLTAILVATTPGQPVHLNAAEPTPTSQQQQQLQERTRLSVEARKLQAEGKLPEALRAAEKMLAIEREVLGDVHDDTAASLQLIASIQAEREEFAAAQKAREEVLSIKLKLLRRAALADDECASGFRGLRASAPTHRRATQAAGRSESLDADSQYLIPGGEIS